MAQGRFEQQTKVALAGSERKPVSGAKAATAGGTGGPITVSVLVRRKAPIAGAVVADPAGRMTQAEFAEGHGADPAAVKLVEEFAAEYGLKMKAADWAGSRTLYVTGEQAALERAFGVQLRPHAIGGKLCRVREGAIYLPEELAGVVEAVLGLDDRPQAVPHFRVLKPNAVNTSFTPVQVATLYGYPAGASAAGQTIGLIELGSGFREADIAAYFQGLGVVVPTVTAVSVDGGANTPGDANGADGEVMLDIEVSAAVAPGVKLAVYFAPNTDQGFIDAVTQAVHDTTNAPSVISISWGGPEDSWTAQATTALDEACQAAAVVGVTITVAAGDNGSSDGETDGANHVDFPASSPHVLACGGTKLTGDGSSIRSEVVWNETASQEGATGGVSTVFALPSWQQGVGVPAATTAAGGRGVPDVAGDADPVTGYEVRVDGQTMVIGGTSAVAPLWAGLIALANAQNGVAAGFCNKRLYGAAATAFRDVTEGNNGSFPAGPGWDACTGLGSPMGTEVVRALGATASAP